MFTGIAKFEISSSIHQRNLYLSVTPTVKHRRITSDKTVLNALLVIKMGIHYVSAPKPEKALHLLSGVDSCQTYLTPGVILMPTLAHKHICIPILRVLFGLG